MSSEGRGGAWELRREERKREKKRGDEEKERSVMVNGRGRRRRITGDGGRWSEKRGRAIRKKRIVRELKKS